MPKRTDSGGLKFTEKETKMIRRKCEERARGTVFTDSQFDEFIYAAEQKGLDPLLNQIYLDVRTSDGRVYAAHITGIDGFRMLAERTDKYAPGRDPEYTFYDLEDAPTKKVRSVIESGGQVPKSATVFAMKMTPDGTWHESRFTTYWTEYYPGDNRSGFMYRKFPTVMLAKTAEAQLLRRMFPAETAGLYVPEELMQDTADGGGAGTGSRPAAPSMPGGTGGLGLEKSSTRTGAEDVPEVGRSKKKKEQGPEPEPDDQASDFEQVAGVSGDRPAIDVVRELDGMTGKNLQQQAMYVLLTVQLEVERLAHEKDVASKLDDEAWVATAMSKRLRHWSRMDNGDPSVHNVDHLAELTTKGSKAVTICYGKLKKADPLGLRPGDDEEETPETAQDAPESEDDQTPAQEPDDEAGDADGNDAGAEDDSGDLQLEPTPGPADEAIERAEKEGVGEDLLRSAIQYQFRARKWASSLWQLALENWDDVIREAQRRIPTDDDAKSAARYNVEETREAVAEEAERLGVNLGDFVDAAKEFCGLSDRKKMTKVYCLLAVRMSEDIVDWAGLAGDAEDEQE